MNNPTCDWVCYDCVALAANAELPEDGTTPDGELTERGHALMDSAANRTGSTVGASHHNCGHDADDYDAVTECETEHFSTRRCDSCGSWLGGSRHAMILA